MSIGNCIVPFLPWSQVRTVSNFGGRRAGRQAGALACKWEVGRLQFRANDSAAAFGEMEGERRAVGSIIGWAIAAAIFVAVQSGT